MKLRTPLTLLAVAVLSACAASGPGKMAPYSQAALPPAMQVPAGHRVALETRAAGDITYQCRAKKDMAGQFEWVFVGPDAGLKDRSGQRVGKYYGPPATWESNDGSKITATQLAVAPPRRRQHSPATGQSQPRHGPGNDARRELHPACQHPGRHCTQGGLLQRERGPEPGRGLHRRLHLLACHVNLQANGNSMNELPFFLNPV